MIFTGFIYLSMNLLSPFNISSLAFSLLHTLYIFMFYKCCILCASERKYILGIQLFINKVVICFIYFVLPVRQLRCWTIKQTLPTIWLRMLSVD